MIKIKKKATPRNAGEFMEKLDRTRLLVGI